jgi:hypothetical protein
MTLEPMFPEKIVALIPAVLSGSGAVKVPPGVLSLYSFPDSASFILIFGSVVAEGKRGTMPGLVGEAGGAP